MASFNLINDIFEYCMKKDIEFELNLEKGVNDIQYDSEIKKVTLCVCDQKDDNTEKYINDEFLKLKQLIN